MFDVAVDGILNASCVLGSFTTVTFGFGDGNLGSNCNNAYSSVGHVFRARVTAYTALICTWILLLFS
ncbi:hypothetical protein M441DRAFT_57693 [Trichoderma asperellum CBS 433.97]|uniref:Uncharacterized protein n=2 Tax=Trichoderma asperellum TaxID=101201 RepID=A0A2T3Z9Q8_TRIA4|nr:hypothetical protein M441DRAFT_57693 [Trichoderma asperellum CBS 433.97]PTB41549.1 hypothetical protein M441DRAFT_57693 [Trichoderma asperellum CBS 433.97]